MDLDASTILTAPVAASPTAEQSALGAILTAGDRSADVAGVVFRLARPEMFWRPANELIARLIEAMVDAGIPVDPQTVLARLTESGELSKVGGGPYLMTLMERAWSVAAVESYASEIRDCYRRRQIRADALRAVQQACNPEVDLALVVYELAKATEYAESLAADDVPVHPATLGDLLAYRSEPDWLIPDLLERGERVIITGTEGLGKSYLLAQLAVCLATGVQPFTGTPEHDGVRVLVVDVENPKRLLGDRYRKIVRRVEDVAGVRVDRDRLMVEIREEGIDLTQPADVTWLDRLLTGGRPDVLIIGPLYKLHRQNMNDETAARELAHTLDTLRVRHQLALIIEAHSGQAEDPGGRRKLRPRGSSLFLGWPNVGIGIRAHADCHNDPPNWVEVKPWRGHRDERAWPRELVRGGLGELPWVPPAEFRKLQPVPREAS